MCSVRKQAFQLYIYLFKQLERETLGFTVSIATLDFKQNTQMLYLVSVFRRYT